MPIQRALRQDFEKSCFKGGGYCEKRPFRKETASYSSSALSIRFFLSPGPHMGNLFSISLIFSPVQEWDRDRARDRAKHGWWLGTGRRCSSALVGPVDRVRYSSWLLASSGLAWRFLPSLSLSLLSGNVVFLLLLNHPWIGRREKERTVEREREREREKMLDWATDREESYVA